LQSRSKCRLQTSDVDKKPAQIGFSVLSIKETKSQPPVPMEGRPILRAGEIGAPY
jgi:hypothetical protein